AMFRQGCRRSPARGARDAPIDGFGAWFLQFACLPSAASSPRPRQLFSYNRCSLYVLSRFDQRRNRDMLPRIAAIAGCLAVAAPAHAESASPPQEVSAPSPAHDGYRLGQTADGFQLIEHGI